jgi:hypothetical protein
MDGDAPATTTESLVLKPCAVEVTAVAVCPEAESDVTESVEYVPSSVDVMSVFDVLKSVKLVDETPVGAAVVGQLPVQVYTVRVCALVESGLG